LQCNNHGFSLLEALVALVILSLTFSGVWGFFGTAAQSTTRIEEALALPAAFEQYLDYMTLESLQEQRAGQVAVGEFRFAWQASVNRQSDKEIYRRQRERIITLFDLDVRVLKEERLVSEVSTQVVRQWKDPNYVPPPVFQ